MVPLPFKPRLVAASLLPLLLAAQDDNATDPPLTILDPYLVPKYVTDLFVLPVLHDDGGSPSSFKVSARQFEQQMLPEGFFPPTLTWGFGNPDDPNSFSHPAGTIETTKDVSSTVSWYNELIQDPEACVAPEGLADPANEACNFLPHVVRDQYGVPILKTAFDWAAPNSFCKDPAKEKDCRGNATAPYYGPVPLVVHLHGGHTEAESDGYPEAWYLPGSNDIPEGYHRHGTYYTTYPLPGEEDDAPVDADAYASRGVAVYRYDNTQPTTTLFYHDHTLGISRHNNWAMSSGLYLIRDGNNGETYLDENDCKGGEQRLPGPPPRVGQDPNGDPAIRAEIREMGIVFQEMSFWNDGSMRLDSPRSDYVLVNGNTWPKLEVAPERYRFRLLNGSDKQFYSLYLEARTLEVANWNGRVEVKKELPFYVIGSDHGMLRHVVKISLGKATKLTPCSDPETLVEEDQDNPLRGLLISPGDRYDVIVDFGGLPDGTVVTMKNTGPQNYFCNFDADCTGTEYVLPEEETIGSLMRFVVKHDLANPQGEQSTSPYDLSIQNQNAMGEASVVRDLLGGFSRGYDEPELANVNAPSYWLWFMGLNGSKGPNPDNMVLETWADKITINPSLGSTEVWEMWSWSPNSHPVHLHQVGFEIIERVDANTKAVTPAYPWEQGMKDIVILYPGTLTKVKVHFDLPGKYIWHCHMVGHEDFEQMRPFCVGEIGSDCPADAMGDTEQGIVTPSPPTEQNPTPPVSTPTVISPPTKQNPTPPVSTPTATSSSAGHYVSWFSLFVGSIAMALSCNA